MQIFNLKVGQKLAKAVREELNISQDALAKKLRISRADVALLEQGRRAISDVVLKRLAKLANTAGVGKSIFDVIQHGERVVDEKQVAEAKEDDLEYAEDDERPPTRAMMVTGLLMYLLNLCPSTKSKLGMILYTAKQLEISDRDLFLILWAVCKDGKLHDEDQG